ncbi:DUF302 domain-containing protein [Roseibium sediminicola]|uniref:DUF302 domain-containing protein n=1 Tax=Roseibium sediminicola TaxID=2933272 RepID=A0ABT0GP04_9HYPH|nr:DUF302 domain-containing protein [Roseibium sp. CAU 1639]MCK7611148.1 DUF302 domain-containing protein [Roseibium sp. CAU 1639]
MLKFPWITCLAGAMLLGPTVTLATAQSVPEGVTAYQVEAAFEDVRFDLENAIVNRGLVIDYVSHIGDMLARTSEDVGGEKQIFAEAQAMLFCSANLSRKAMEADAANIAYCPYSVFVYELPDQLGTITVGFRHLAETGSDASKAAIADVNALLDELAREAAGQ